MPGPSRCIFISIWIKQIIILLSCECFCLLKKVKAAVRFVSNPLKDAFYDVIEHLQKSKFLSDQLQMKDLLTRYISLFRINIK